ncbi:replication-associated recombination protein A [Methylonatrum kenyense]|nr:replication-associated recombination protein A [Methylonatrum kenyense]MCK8515721.1 replication-associated recombination protein A [Methylonatrum kenyense]
MRPRTLDDYVGQEAVLGPGKPLRRMVEAGAVRSLVLWGPPGVGKTTLAEILARAVDARLVQLSAVSAGVKDIRKVAADAEEAKRLGQRTVLFLDEIHRFNKSQQDALLPHVESGLLTLLGASTENISFELNSALLSRLRVYVLKPLDEAAMVEILRRALTDSERGLGARRIQVDDETLARLARVSGGDARRALGLLETASDFAESDGDRDVLSQAAVDEVIGHVGGAMDKSGDAYYDLLSAIHKSIRSSRVDASLYYIARFISGGGDPLDVIRRLTAIASEDVGNADPRALPLVIAAWDAYLRLGQYEGERAIAHAAIHLAIAPKSNAIDQAWKAASAAVRKHPHGTVPPYLRNAPTSLMKELGHGQGYRYAHSEPNAYPAGSAHDCWPDGVPQQVFYQPSDFGQEKRFREMLDYRATLDRQEDERQP